jgi:hypothetical protein
MYCWQAAVLLPLLGVLQRPVLLVMRVRMRQQQRIVAAAVQLLLPVRLQLRQIQMLLQQQTALLQMTWTRQSQQHQHL